MDLITKFSSQIPNKLYFVLQSNSISMLCVLLSELIEKTFQLSIKYFLSQEYFSSRLSEYTMVWLYLLSSFVWGLREGSRFQIQRG